MEYPGKLTERYDVTETEDPMDTLRGVAENRGCIKKGSEPDLKRAAFLLLDDFRNGRMGRITLERAEE